MKKALLAVFAALILVIAAPVAFSSSAEATPGSAGQMKTYVHDGISWTHETKSGYNALLALKITNSSKEMIT